MLFISGEGKDLPKVALRNIRRNKLRTALTISAITFTTLVIVFMFSVIQGMKEDARTTLVGFVTGQIQIRDSEYEKNAVLYPLDLTVNNYETYRSEIEKIDGVKTATPRIQFGLDIGTIAEKTPEGLTIFSETQKGMGFAMDFIREEHLSDLGKYMAEGGIFPQGSEVLVGGGLAQELDLETGDSMIVFLMPRGYFSSRPVQVRISGIVNLPLIQINNKALFFPLDTAQTLLAMEGSATQMLLSVEENRDLGAIIKQVMGILTRYGEQTLEARPWNSIGSTAMWLELAEQSYNVIALFFFVIGTTVIVVTTMMVIYERMKEIGTLAAMGMTGLQLMVLFFMEALFLSMIAAGIGVFLGIGLVAPFSSQGIDLNALIDLEKTDISISNIIYPQINFNSTIFVFFYSVTVASIASLLASRRVEEIEPIEALSSL